MRVAKILPPLIVCLASSLATAQEKNCSDLTNPQARQECMVKRFNGEYLDHIEIARLESAKRDLPLPLEGVIFDLLCRRQSSSLYTAQLPEVVLGSRTLGVEVFVGKVIAESIGVAPISTRKGCKRIASQTRFVTLVEQPMKRCAWIRRLRRGTCEGNCSAS